MADDFLGIPLDLPENVPAETQSDGAVTEDYTGEQVADEAGNPDWWDSNYPGQTQNAPAAAVDESAAETARLAQQNQTATGTPIDVSSSTASLPTVATSLQGAITNSPAVPTQDAYGLNILNAAETQQLTRNINPAFINSLVDPNTPITTAATNAVNTSATNVPVFVDSSGIVYDPVTGVSYPVDSAGKQIIPANVSASIDPVAQSRIETFNRTPVVSATAVDTGAGAAIAAANQQTAAAAAQLNAQSPNPYLTNIDEAAAQISKGQDGIATANQTIQSAQQKISDSESYIAQNNAELADPNISAERRAVLEANNAAQVQNIFDQNQSITENQTYITQTQETIQFNEAAIDTNSAGYRATTAGANVPVVDVNTDPNFVGPQQITAAVINPTTNAAPVNVQDGQAFGPVFPDPTGNGGFVDAAGNPVNADGTPIFPAARFTTAAQDSAIQTQVGRQLAQQQAVTAAQKKIINNGDWRVRLSLAPGARYLYNVDDPGILAPLAVTGGVVFPYTPKIEMSYKADYESYALTHSNYKGYFYKSSYTDTVGMMATFTAQDSNEADYLLAVIHFFRSVTKMFYGQDPQRGAPPPLVYLTGLGQYQFSGHPCVVTSFNYNLPSDVDYIRARSTNINGTNLLTRRDRQDLPTNPISGAVARLQNLFSGQGISYGAERNRPQPPTLGLNQPTYVPTKMDITLSLLPVQTRSQVTNQFSVADYASGALLKGGFW